MKIDSIQIDNFRSIAHLEFRPAPLTVMVGPNNSGKSNIADALEFLGDCYRGNPSWAIEQRGGWDRVVYRLKSSTRNRTIKFRITLRCSGDELAKVNLFEDRNSDPQGDQELVEHIDGQEYVVTHHFALRPGRAESRRASRPPLKSQLSPGCFVSFEEILIEKRLSNKSTSSIRLTLNPTMTITRRGDDSVLEHTWGVLSRDSEADIKEFFESLFGSLSNRSSLAMPMVLRWFSFGQEVIQQLETIQAYQPETSACRKSSSPKSYVFLERNGEELPALVATLKDRLPDRFERLVGHMRSLVPNLKTLEIRETDDLQWVIDFVEHKPSRVWRSVEMSDGTMRSLALYSAIFQPRGAITIVEEPENTLHPWVIREFVQTCRDLHMDRSIVLTSHSPALIDLLNPEEIAVVWKEAGQTKLSNLVDLLPSVHKSWSEGRSTLYEILDSGIVPQSVPGGEM